MKVKFNTEQYKEIYMENDIVLVNRLCDKIKSSYIAFSLVYILINTFLLFKNNTYLLLNIAFLIATAMVVYPSYVFTLKYQTYPTFALLVKNYMIRGIFVIVQFMFTVIAIILLLPDENDVKLVWIVLLIAGGIIFSIIFLHNDQKYMRIEDHNPDMLSVSLSALLSFFVIKLVGKQIQLLPLVLFICYLMSLSGVTKNVTRSLRLLAHAPEEILMADPTQCGEVS